MKRWVEELEHARFGAGRYSQSYQDQLLDLIFANVATVNRPPYCVEFGFNSTSLTEGSGANVAKLVLEHGWQGLLLDGEHDNPAIGLHRHFLLPSNIAEVFRRYGVPQQPEYVSIDVDSIDLWLFEALLPAYPALVFSVEYNANYPLDAAITFPNDAQQHWQRDRGYGASLKALTLLAQRLRAAVGGAGGGRVLHPQRADRRRLRPDLLPVRQVARPHRDPLPSAAARPEPAAAVPRLRDLPAHRRRPGAQPRQRLSGVPRISARPEPAGQGVAQGAALRRADQEALLMDRRGAGA